MAERLSSFSPFPRVRDKRDGWCLVSPAAVPGRGDLALPEGWETRVHESVFSATTAATEGNV